MDLQQKTRTLLKDFVSHPSVSDMYAALVIFGPQTISALSRSSGVERTRIYRCLHELQALQLIEIELQPHRQIVRAASISNLQNTVAQKKAHLHNLESQIKAYERECTLAEPHTDVATKVQFYKGQEGIEQLFWNQTKAQSAIVSILTENMQSHVPKAFFERWVQRCNENNIQCKSIVDDHFIESQKQWYGGRFSHSLKNWQGRKMPADISVIPHRTTVYDNITTYFSWQDGDLFGIEIYNQAIADSQRQYFELLWQKSTAIS
jgi:DNA-binding transcriptional regulator GbsR (MarR family)